MGCDPSDTIRLVAQLKAERTPRREGPGEPIGFAQVGPKGEASRVAFLDSGKAIYLAWHQPVPDGTVSVVVLDPGSVVVLRGDPTDGDVVGVVSLRKDRLEYRLTCELITRDPNTP